MLGITQILVFSIAVAVINSLPHHRRSKFLHDINDVADLLNYQLFPDLGVGSLDHRHLPDEWIDYDAYGDSFGLGAKRFPTDFMGNNRENKLSNKYKDILSSNLNNKHFSPETSSRQDSNESGKRDEATYPSGNFEKENSEDIQVQNGEKPFDEGNRANDNTPVADSFESEENKIKSKNELELNGVGAKAFKDLAADVIIDKESNIVFPDQVDQVKVNMASGNANQVPLGSINPNGNSYTIVTVPNNVNQPSFDPSSAKSNNDPSQNLGSSTYYLIQLENGQQALVPVDNNIQNVPQVLVVDSNKSLQQNNVQVLDTSNGQSIPQENSQPFGNTNGQSNLQRTVQVAVNNGQNVPQNSPQGTPITLNSVQSPPQSNAQTYANNNGQNSQPGIVQVSVNNGQNSNSNGQNLPQGSAPITLINNPNSPQDSTQITVNNGLNSTPANSQIYATNNGQNVPQIGTQGLVDNNNQNILQNNAQNYVNNNGQSVPQGVSQVLVNMNGQNTPQSQGQVFIPSNSQNTQSNSKIFLLSNNQNSPQERGKITSLNFGPNKPSVAGQISPASHSQILPNANGLNLPQEQLFVSNNGQNQQLGNNQNIPPNNGHVIILNGQNVQQGNRPIFVPSNNGQSVPLSNGQILVLNNNGQNSQQGNGHILVLNNNAQNVPVGTGQVMVLTNGQGVNQAQINIPSNLPAGNGQILVLGNGQNMPQGQIYVLTNGQYVPAGRVQVSNNGQLMTSSNAQTQPLNNGQITVIPLNNNQNNPNYDQTSRTVIPIDSTQNKEPVTLLVYKDEADSEPKDDESYKNVEGEEDLSVLDTEEHEDN